MNAENIQPLTQLSQLLSLIDAPNVIIIDARSGPEAQERYEAGHLKGAIHLDLDRDLSQKPENAAIGGRHPLPDLKVFGELLGKIGITPDTHVIIYDDKKGANAAARLWWMLKAGGHKQVQVLDGGLDAALGAGVALTKDLPEITAAPPYPLQDWTKSTININEVEQLTGDPGYLIIDVREAYRYRGESEPIDPVAGHIPGAINIPYISNLDNEGQFLSKEKLAAKYQEAIGNRITENVIVHCGSGVTACHTLLALEQAGISGAKLYVGSWSEWCRSGRTIVNETGKQ